MMTASSADLSVLVAQQRDLEDTLAAFTCWLDRQPLPPERRSLAREKVAQFLRWRHTDFTAIGSSTATAVWCYLQWRRREHLSDQVGPRTWAALDLFLSYTAQLTVDDQSIREYASPPVSDQKPHDNERSHQNGRYQQIERDPTQPTVDLLQGVVQIEVTN